MPETLTESFCERCGTRYAFDPPKPEPRRRSIGKALGLARDSSANGRTATLDPFLAIFRFCLGCRQYVCPGCWNEHAGFCATCEPFPEAPPLEVKKPDVEAEVEGLHLHVGAEAWPLLDLAREGTTAAVPDGVPDADLAAVGEAQVADEHVLQARADETESTDPGIAGDTASSTQEGIAEAPPTHPISPIAEAIEEPALANLVAEPVADDRNHRDQELDVSWNHLLLVALPPSDQTVIEAPPADWRAAVVPFETMTAEPATEGQPLEAQQVDVQPIETDQAEPQPDPIQTVEAQPDPIQTVEATLQTSTSELELEPLAEVEPEPEQIAESETEALSEIDAAEPESQDPVETVSHEPHATELHATEPQVPMHVEPEAEPGEVVSPPAAPPAPPPAPVVPPWRFTAPDQPRRDTAVQPVWRSGSPAETQSRPPGLDAPSAAEMPGAFYVPQAHASGGTPAMVPQRASARPEMRPSASSPTSGVRPCGSCALPLSASARFCRRCGASQ